MNLNPGPRYTELSLSPINGYAFDNVDIIMLTMPINMKARKKLNH